jgi:hypothetical protein
MLSGRSILAGAVAFIAVWGAGKAGAAGAFTLSSPDFKDGERLALKNAGNNKANPNCVGENVSPTLNWSNPPDGTKSYALLMIDPEGRQGAGVIHWVAYGIPVSVTGFAEGEAFAFHRALHAIRHGAASLHLHADRDRSRPESPAARLDAGGPVQGARRPCQRGDRPDRHLLQAVKSPDMRGKP